MNTELPIRIRVGTESDVAFVFSSWLKSYRDSSFGRKITTTIYFSEHHKVIENILKTCQVYIACADNDVSDIYGYAVGETVDGIFVLHYIYVKQTYRNLGIAKLLLSQFNVNGSVASIATHMTKTAEKIAPKYNMIYSPYVALIPEYRGGGMVEIKVKNPEESADERTTTAE